MTFGIIFVYVAGLAWYFDLCLSRFGCQNNNVGHILFAFIGIVFLLTAAFRSRQGLVKDSDLITKSPDEIDLSGEPDIPASERVKRANDSREQLTGK